MNPVSYFEIPVRDMDRAVLGYRLVREQVDGNEMALFPAVEGGSGASGALAKGEVYVPAMTGPIVYFATADIEKTLGLAGANGGKTLYPKTAVGKNGFVAEFADSEGNRIALHQAVRSAGSR